MWANGFSRALWDALMTGEAGEGSLMRHMDQAARCALSAHWAVQPDRSATSVATQEYASASCSQSEARHATPVYSHKIASDSCHEEQRCGIVIRIAGQMHPT